MYGTSIVFKTHISYQMLSRKKIKLNVLQMYKKKKKMPAR